MAAWACGDACAKGRADEQAVYALRTLRTPRRGASRRARRATWPGPSPRARAAAAAAATDNATVADVVAFLDRPRGPRAVGPPRDVATALWACAKIAEAVEVLCGNQPMS